MSASSGDQGGDSLEFDLNLAPIIDCFTVLITFMLVSATFLSVSILDASVAPLITSVPATATPPPPPKGVSLAVELLAGGEIELRITGEETRTARMPASGAGWDNGRLVQELNQVKVKWPSTKQLTLSAGEMVEYRELVRSLEAIRGVVPAVLLGGF